MSRRQYLWLAWLTSLTLVGFLLKLASAANSTAEPAAKDEPVQVTADRMVSNSRTDQVVFSGNVELRRGELYVKADRLDITQDHETKKVSQMVATGSVFIRRGEQAATAEHATFFENEQKAVLTGNPHAWEGSTEVWGEEMVFLMGEGSMLVTGGPQRVRVQLLPNKEGTPLPTGRTRGQGGSGERPGSSGAGQKLPSAASSR
jgi:lipopolysaccharide export system protein LptA